MDHADLDDAVPSAPADDWTERGLSARQFAMVQPFLRESVIVLDERWEVKANLAAPDGLLGWGDPVGTHALAHIHSDDVLQFVDLEPELSSTDPGWIGAAQLRLQRVDGSYGRYEITMHNRLADPEIQGWVVCTRELSEVVSTAPELGSTLLAQSLADALPHGVLVLDGRAKPLFANQAACELLGVDIDEITVHGLDHVLTEEGRAAVQGAARRLGRAPGRETVGFRRADDPDRRFELVFTSQPNSDVLRGGSDAVLIVFGVLEDVTHEIARQEQLEQRATRDDLTGLRNRAWLLDRLHAAVSADEAITVAYLDLCGFKAVNDRLGHRAGDRVLAAVAVGLIDAFGDGAVARVGGDEFVVVAPGDVSVASLVDRCREAVASPDDARSHDVTVSVGVARIMTGDEPWGLLERADAAMYADKRRRRHEPAPPSRPEVPPVDR